MDTFRFVYGLIVLFALLAASCAKEKDYIVAGNVNQPRLEGTKVFLVPCDPSLTMLTSKALEDSIGVDSAVIREGKFEFRGKGEFLARVTIDKHARYGTQDLLIFTEPGKTVNVVIDSISSGGGTPQNEAMQKWKELKQAHDAITGPMVVRAHRLRMSGDSIAARALSDTIRIINDQYVKEVLDVARILGSGPAYDFLMNRFQAPTHKGE